jgi:putative transposase
VTAIGQASDGDESFNGKLRNELLNGEILYTLREAQVLIENWRQHYKRIRPHSALGYRPPAPETTVVRLTAESRIGETRNAA